VIECSPGVTFSMQANLGALQCEFDSRSFGSFGGKESARSTQPQATGGVVTQFVIDPECHVRHHLIKLACSVSDRLVMAAQQSSNNSSTMILTLLL
jgi:hypothetical protein